MAFQYAPAGYQHAPLPQQPYQLQHLHLYHQLLHQAQQAQAQQAQQAQQGLQHGPPAAGLRARRRQAQPGEAPLPAGEEPRWGCLPALGQARPTLGGHC
jgi:hypothetical protein